jgi:hypothetical protein
MSYMVMGRVKSSEAVVLGEVGVASPSWAAVAVAVAEEILGEDMLTARVRVERSGEEILGEDAGDLAAAAGSPGFRAWINFRPLISLASLCKPLCWWMMGRMEAEQHGMMVYL